MKTAPARSSVVWVLFSLFAALTILTVSGIGGFVLYRDYRRFQMEADGLRANHINDQQQLIKDEVDKVIDFIHYSWSKTEERLKASIKERTYEAHAIASHLHRENRDRMSGQDLRKVILDALRPIRFNNGRGYYFATALDGEEILFADHPELEGKNLLDMQDTRGAYVIRDMIDLVRREEEGYYRYSWTKPHAPGKDFPKISFLRHFAPFDGFIGTGEYLDDVEKDIQQEVLARIGKIRFGRDGYIFVVTYAGETIMNSFQPELIGRNLWDMTDPDGVRVIQEERRAVEAPQGGFIHYRWEKPSTGRITPKISFARGFAQWGWMIGAGVYTDDVESVIAAKKAEVQRNMRNDMLGLCLILLAILATVLPLSYFLARYFKRELELFLSFFREMETGGKPIAMAGIRLREFEHLARTANSMLERRRLAEDALRESEERYRSLYAESKKREDLYRSVLNSSADAIVIYDMQGRASYVNPAFSRIFGWEFNEIQGRRIPFVPEPERERSMVVIRELIRNGTPCSGFETRRLTKTGNLLDVSISASRFHDHQGNPEGMLAMLSDITDRKRAEEDRVRYAQRLQQAQKAESLARMAGAIAHHFNNLLGAVMGNLELAMGDLPEESGLREYIAEALTASRRAAEISARMLAYLGQSAGEKEPVDLLPVCKETILRLSPSLPKNVRLSIAPPGRAPIIRANAGQIQQIMINLVVNACEAIGEREGDITVSIGMITATEIRAYRSYPPDWDPKEEPYACLSVSDTGCGMYSDMLGKIFDPFFSTKFTGRGLGLAVVLGLVRAHGGAVAVESEPGRGAKFQVFLPVGGLEAKAQP